MRTWFSWDDGRTWNSHDAPTTPEVVVTAPTWWGVAGCRRHVPRTRTRCIRIVGHRGTCLPIPRREYRRG